MILIRHVTDLISRHELAPERRVQWNGGKVFEYCEGKNARACIANNRLVTRESKEADEIPADGSTLYFIEAHHGPEFWATVWLVTKIVAAVAAIVSAGVSAYQLLNPSSVGLQQKPGGSDEGDGSATFGFGGISNVVRNGSVIPVVYGRHRVGGAIIQAWRTAGADLSQRLHMIIALSHGQISAIGVGDNAYSTDQDNLTNNDLPSGMLINRVQADKFDGIACHLRMGDTDQAVMPGFEEIVTEYEQSFRLDEESFEWTTKDEVDAVFCNLNLPGGLWQTDSKGETESNGVNFILSAFELDGVTAIASQEFRLRAKARTSIFYTLRLDGLSLVDNGPGAQGPRRVIFKIRRSAPLPPGYTRTGKKVKQDQADLISVNEVRSAPLTYPGLALVGLHLQASEKLQGGMPTVTSMVDGRLIEVGQEDESFVAEFSRNPAWIARDIITNPIYGGGNVSSAATPVFDYFKEWADFCDELVPIYTHSEDTEPRYQVDMVYDTERPIWEVLLQLGGIARGVFIMDGDKIKVRPEKARLPSQLFTPGNIVEKSYEVSFVNPLDRANLIEAHFLNASLDYEHDMVQADTPGRDESTGDVRKKQVDIFGCTSATQAKRHASYLLRHEARTGKIFRHRAGIDAIACEPVDVIAVAPPDHVEWAYGGRLLGLDGDKNIKLDKQVALTANLTYTYVERRNYDDTRIETEFVPAETESTDIVPFVPATLSVLDFSALSGAVITVIAGGDTFVLTEGVEWSASADNETTVGTIVAALGGILFSETVSPGVVSLFPKSEISDIGGYYRLDYITTDASPDDLLIIHRSQGMAGALWSLGPRAKRYSEGLVTRVKATDNAMMRDIECIEYVESVYSDDSEPLETGAFLKDLGDPPARVFRATLTVTDFSLLSGAAITIRRVGGYELESIVLTEGVDWAAAVTNELTAISIAGAISGDDYLEADVSGAAIRVNPEIDALGFKVSTDAASGLTIAQITVTESSPSPEKDVTRLTAAWQTPAIESGEAEPTGYQLWVRDGQDGAHRLVGEPTAGNSKSVDLRAHLGSLVDLRIQTIAITGRRESPESAPAILYSTRRADASTLTGRFPANVTNPELVQASENSYTLSWDAVTLDIEGNAIGATVFYDVRVGGWTGGAIVYQGTATSTSVKLNKRVLTFYIRAYVKVAADNWFYSPDAAAIESEAVAPDAFTTESMVKTYDFSRVTIGAEPDEDDGVIMFTSGEASNASLIKIPQLLIPTSAIVGAERDIALLNLDPESDMEYVSEDKDLLVSALTYASIQCEVMPYAIIGEGAIELHNTAPNWSFFGPIGGYKPAEQSIEWTAELETSADGVLWRRAGEFRDAMKRKADITATARWFRLRFKGRAKPIFLPTDFGLDEENDPGAASARQIVAKPMLFILGLTLMRA